MSGRKLKERSNRAASCAFQVEVGVQVASAHAPYEADSPAVRVRFEGDAETLLLAQR